MKITPARLKYWESMKGKSGNGFKKGHTSYLKTHSEETKKKLHDIAIADGRKPDFTGYIHRKESRVKMSEAKKQNPTMYWCGKDRSAIFTEEYRKNMSLIMKKRVASGIHNFWKGGKTAESKLQRTTTEYKFWRKKVFERDDYTCQLCFKRGCELNADHIKPFALYPELRFELSNGRTLCVDCHKKTDTYGRGTINLINKHKQVTI